MGSHVPQFSFALGKFISEGFKKRKLHSETAKDIMGNPYVNANVRIYARDAMGYKRA